MGVRALDPMSGSVAARLARPVSAYAIHNQHVYIICKQSQASWNCPAPWTLGLWILWEAKARRATEKSIFTAVNALLGVNHSARLSAIGWIAQVSIRTIWCI